MGAAQPSSGTAGFAGTGTRGVRILQALLVPADATRPVAVIHVPNCSANISEAIGAHLLDDSTVGTLATGPRFTIYTCLQPAPATLPNNPRAAALAASLGLDTDQTFLARMRGDVLVTGLAARCDDDRDVPHQIVDLAFVSP
jgi:hypothetical protein